MHLNFVPRNILSLGIHNNVSKGRWYFLYKTNRIYFLFILPTVTLDSMNILKNSLFEFFRIITQDVAIDLDILLPSGADVLVIFLTASMFLKI